MLTEDFSPLLKVSGPLFRGGLSSWLDVSKRFTGGLSSSLEVSSVFSEGFSPLRDGAAADDLVAFASAEELYAALS